MSKAVKEFIVSMETARRFFDERRREVEAVERMAKKLAAERDGTFLALAKFERESTEAARQCDRMTKQCRAADLAIKRAAEELRLAGMI